jgi:hypothetical protein
LEKDLEEGNFWGFMSRDLCWASTFQIIVRDRLWETIMYYGMVNPKPIIHTEKPCCSRHITPWEQRVKFKVEGIIMFLIAWPSLT